MYKIKKWSRVMRILFQIILIAMPIWAFFQWWVYFDKEALSIFDSLRHEHPNLSYIAFFPYSTRIICFVIALIPNLVAMFGFYHLIKLFRLYELGQIFTKDNINPIKICSYTILFWFIANFITSVLLVLALTLNNPVGQRILAIKFDAKDFSTLVIGVIAIIIAQIMDEARKIKDENDYTV